MEIVALQHPDPSSARAPAAACLECGAALRGPFCHACGQRHPEGPLRLRGIVADFLDRQLSLERGLLRTFVRLSTRPGEMIREYVDGRRTRYTSPVAYLLVSAALHLLVLPLWVERMRTDAVTRVSGMGTDADAFAALLTSAMEYPVVVTLVSCLFFVPALRALAGGGTTLAESTVFTLYVMAHASILAVLLTPAMLLAGAGVTTLTNLSLLVMTWVMSHAALGFLGRRVGTVLRVIAASVLAMLGMIGVAVVAFLTLSTLGVIPGG